MAKRGYTNLQHEAGALFNSLRPGYDALQKAQDKCSPFGAHYHQLETLIKAHEAAAQFFTGSAIFFQDRPDAYTTYDQRLLGPRS